MQNEILERVSGWIPSGRAKATSALLVLNGHALGATDVPQRRQPTRIFSSRDVITVNVGQLLAPGAVPYNPNTDVRRPPQSRFVPQLETFVYSPRSPLIVLDGTVAMSADIFCSQDVIGWPPFVEPWAPVNRTSLIILNLPLVTGTGAIAEAADVVSGSGKQSVSGTGTIAEGADVVAGVGTQVTAGSGAISEAPDTVAGAGTVALTGTGAIAEAADVVAGTGSVTLAGSGNIAEAADTVSGHGTAGGAGSGAINEAPDVVAGVGSTGGLGAGAIAEAPDTVAGTGNISIPGSGAITEPADVVAGIGISSTTGAGAIAEATDIVSGAGTKASVGAGAIAEAPDVVAGAGTQASTGSGAIVEPPDVVTGVAAGTGAINEAPDVVAGVGVVQNPSRFGNCTMTVSSATIIEESACFVTVNFVDSNGNPFLPATAQYRLDDVASGTQILDWTQISLNGTTILIVVNAAENALIGRPFETHQCLVQLTDGFGNVDNVRVTWGVCQVVGLPN